MGELLRPGDTPLQPAEGAEVDAQLPHLFDYCRALLGRDDTAAATALAVMTSAQELMGDPQRMRADLFGLARRHAVALLPYSSDEAPYDLPAAAGASARRASQFMLSAFGELTYRDREILDLVYRHGIRPADLPAVLAIPAEEAYRRLVNAEAEFITLVADPTASLGVLDDFGELPLAALPAPDAGGRRRHRQPVPSTEAPLWHTVARRRIQLAGVAVIPLIAIGWGLMYLAAARPADTATHARAALHGTGVSPPAQVAGTPDPAATARPTGSASPAFPIALLLPVPAHSGSQALTLPPPLVSATPPPPTIPPPTTPPPTIPPPTTPPPTTPPPTTPPPTPTTPPPTPTS
jgi:DNA-directed RNA polymerase specialized sigma24 family protein